MVNLRHYANGVNQKSMASSISIYPALKLLCDLTYPVVDRRIKTHTLKVIELLMEVIVQGVLQGVWSEPTVKRWDISGFKSCP